MTVEVKGMTERGGAVITERQLRNDGGKVRDEIHVERERERDKGRRSRSAVRKTRRYQEAFVVGRKEELSGDAITRGERSGGGGGRNAADDGAKHNGGKRVGERGREGD